MLEKIIICLDDMEAELRYQTLSSFSSNAMLDEREGQIFRNGARLVYQDYQVQNFTIDVLANKPWDYIFPSQAFTSGLPDIYPKLPPAQPGDLNTIISDFEIKGPLIESLIPYGKISCLQFLVGCDDGDSGIYRIGVQCKTSVSFQIKGIAGFVISVRRG
jgi:hypothetical protein